MSLDSGTEESIKVRLQPVQLKRVYPVIAPSTFVKSLQYLAWLFCVHSLLDEQIDILLAAASGSDVLALLPTGFGKTISFWAPPFFFDFVFNGDPRDEVNRVLSSDSTLIKPILVVVSPLNNLMQEQCAVLRKLKTAPEQNTVSFVHCYSNHTLAKQT
jgi:superfamily II DNA helicase RecQ